jgi:hypothetical protein
MKMQTQLWDTANLVLRGKLIAMSAYIKNTERSKINDLMLQIKLLEKKNELNSKQTEREK